MRFSRSRWSFEAGTCWNWETERGAALPAKDVHRSRGRYQEGVAAVRVAACFTGRTSLCMSYFPDHIVDRYLSVVERRDPPFYPYTWHRRILPPDHRNVASPVVRRVSAWLTLTGQ